MAASTANKYIDNCIELGITKRVDICEHAKKELEEIDIQLKKAELLRQKRSEIIDVLKVLGDDLFASNNKKDNDIPNIELNGENSTLSKEIQTKICSFLEEHKSATNRELINHIASYNEDYVVIRAIKVLARQDIIQKTQDSKIVPGINWNKRTEI